MGLDAGRDGHPAERRVGDPAYPELGVGLDHLDEGLICVGVREAGAQIRGPHPFGNPDVGADQESQCVEGKRECQPGDFDMFEGKRNVLDPDFFRKKEAKNGKT